MNCEGCKWELCEAIMAQDEYELYYATSTDREYRHNKHFAIWMVNDKGETKIE